MPGAHDRSVSDVPLEHPRRGEWKLKNLFIYMQDPELTLLTFLEFTRELYSVYGSIVHSIAESTSTT